jgi:hypothetical protein
VLIQFQLHVKPLANDAKQLTLNPMTNEPESQRVRLGVPAPEDNVKPLDYKEQFQVITNDLSYVTSNLSCFSGSSCSFAIRRVRIGTVVRGKNCPLNKSSIVPVQLHQKHPWTAWIAMIMIGILVWIISKPTGIARKPGCVFVLWHAAPGCPVFDFICR